MKQTSIPPIDLADNPTGCCPRFKPEPWHGKQMHLEEQLFVKASVRCLFHIPLNIGAMFTRVMAAIDKADAHLADTHLTMSYSPSLWSSEHYFAVSKEVPGEQMVTLSGDFLLQVYEGPFSKAGSWAKDLRDYVKLQNRTLARSYFFYTTCPSCAKTYGKNYVVGIGQVLEQS